MFWLIILSVLGSVALLLLALVFFLKAFERSKKEDLEGWWWWGLVLGLAVVSGATLGSAYMLGRLGGATPAPTILAAWVQVVPGDEACAPTLGDRSGQNPPPAPAIGQCRPKFSARAVVNGADECPPVTVDIGSTSTSGRMEKRQGYAGKGLQGVTVCAAAAASDTSRVRFNATVTIAVTESWSTNRPQKIVLFGDTGCKPNQGCDSNKWPFAKVASQATGEKPGLVVHLGDYIYQGNDDWVTWKKYFFDPAKSLLEAAPWIVVRGNHERCSSSSGQYPLGFYLLFGDGPAMACNSTAELAKPYAVDLSEQLRLIVADSVAAFADKPATVTSECGTKTMPKLGLLDLEDAKVCAAVMDVLRGVQYLVPLSLRIHASGEESADRPQVWLATHVPIFGFERDKGKDVIPKPSAMMKAAWKGVKVRGVDLVLSGDRHLYQVVTAHGEPKQVSVGTGGVQLDDLPYATTQRANEAEFVTLAAATGSFAADQTIPLASVPTPTPQFSQEGCSYVDFGFLVAEWKKNSYDRSFKPLPPSTGPKSCP
jgi:calcineurin-like phosphoesterase family protein